MVRRSYRNFSYWGLAVVFSFAAGYFIHNRLESQDQILLKNVLAIPELPRSVANIDCWSALTPDVITTCVFSLDPQEFPAILAGWKFGEKAGFGSNFSYAQAGKLGEEFYVSREFYVEPAEFKHGGFVRIVANHEKTRAQIDIYEE